MTADAGVRRKLMLILLSWRRHFMHDPAMVYVKSLYGQCGGVDRVKPTLSSVGRGAPFEETAEQSREQGQSVLDHGRVFVRTPN